MTRVDAGRNRAAAAAVAWLALALLPGLVLAGQREQYARQWPIIQDQEQGQEHDGAYRVELNDQVYRTAVHPALADLEVFNGQGQAQPTAVMSQAQPLARAPRMRALPWFPLPTLDPAAGGGDQRLLAERDEEGGIVRVEATTGAPGRARLVDGQWLIDASGLGEPVRALLLDWERPRESLQARYRVEGSNDLRSWRTLNDGTTLLDLERGGERLREGRIPLDGQARYLRLLPVRPGQVPVLTAVHAELSPPPARVAWEWLEIEGRRRSEGGREHFDFVLPGRFPVERADVRLPGNNAVQWTLYSRERADAGWRWRAGPWMSFQVGAADGGNRSEPRALSPVLRERHWRLTPASPVGEAMPVLRLGYRPEVAVFLAQDAAPFALAAGSANVQRAEAPIPDLLDALRKQRGPGWQPAPARLAQAAEELAGERALQPQRQIDWKSLLLWSLLVGGALLVAALGLSLLRQRPAPQD